MLPKLITITAKLGRSSKKVARGRADVTHKRKSSNAEFEKSQKNQNIFDDFEARNFMYPLNNDTV